ncbi:MAG: hypothetical protein JNN08_15225 [Bryobacterales bacterium]|nr:hypothetical protein [Bryobacterales bacterium]
MRAWAVLCLFAAVAAAQPPANRPVIRVSQPNPTQDKPQSKLWFAQGSWWAWLPDRGGSGIWRRTAAGWQRDSELDGVLRGLPGQADVWADGETVRAVLVESRRLAVVGLRFEARLGRYRPTGDAAVHDVGPGLETATIARDGRGRWWIAYAEGRQMWVRVSQDRAGKVWTPPIAVSQEPASEDDICAITAMPGGVAVLWSNQATETVYFRRHDDRAKAEVWADPEVVDRGNRTADDHLNTAVGRDGTLYLASKNSVDRIGHTQLVLHIRDPRGRWKSHPYAPRTALAEPSRPIVLLGGDEERYFLLHTMYDRREGQPSQSWIARQTALDREAQALISAGTRINNVTGCKAGLPAGAPWIVLASDHEGNVYEARLD